MAESYVERYWRERREAEEALKKAVDHMAEEEMQDDRKTEGKKRHQSKKNRNQK